MKSQKLLEESYTIWINGLSGAGKTSIAIKLKEALQEVHKQVIIIDGDEFRERYSQDLGFSIADRIENIKRAANLAKEYNDKGYLCICAFISPTNFIRKIARDIISTQKFIEVFIDVPLVTCMNRDPKKLYHNASKGKILNLTGINSPFEKPDRSDLNLDGNLEVEKNVAFICSYIDSHKE